MGKDEVPGEEFLDLMDWMVCNTGEHVREVGFRIDTVQLCRADQGVHRGSAFAADIGSRKKIVLSAQSHSPQAAFGGVIVDLQSTIVAIAK